MTTTNKVSRRKLGALSVSSIGLGCMGMSFAYGPADEAESLATLNRALEIGVDFWDTADMYGVGRNEELLAKVLRTRRGEVTLATKFGNVMAPDGKFVGVNGRPEYVRAACEASLKRLGVDHIDLYYQHRVDPNVAIEETVGAMAELVKAGKVRHLGLSEAAPATVRRAAAVHPIAALQSEFSMWTREVARDALSTCRELDIGFVAYSPLGRGFLTGTFQKPDDLPERDWRRSNPRFAGEAFDHNLKLVHAITGIAKGVGVTPAQLALAWLLHQGNDIVPIPGTRKSERLDENAAATRLKLGPTVMAQIEGALNDHTIAGTRYPEANMKAVQI